MVRARRLGVLAAAIGWFLGLYVLPLAHNLDHRDDHHHGPASDDHSHPHEPEPDRVPVDSDHGSGSVLHFAAAALPADTVDVQEAGPLGSLPEAPSPRLAALVSIRSLPARGPPVFDSF